MSTYTPCAEPAAPPVHLSSRLLLAVDIEGYGGRTPRIQLQMREALNRAMETAASGAGLDRGRWLRQDSRDGELAVLPVDVDVFAAVGRFAPALERALVAMRGDAGEAGPLRVRLALHYGTLIMDSAAPGSSGDAPVVVVERLLDARPLRRHLSVRPERNVALIVSDLVFRDVVCNGLCALPPAHFYSVRSTIRGTVHQCHIYDPDRGGDEDSRGGDPLAVQAPSARSVAGEPSDEPGAELYQRVLEQAQHNPPGYDVEAELGRLTEWMRAPQRPGADVAEADDNASSSAPGSLPSPEQGFWGRLTEIEQAALIASAVEVVYPAGTILWSEGQSADQAVVIRSGLVRISANRKGREPITAFRGPGDIIGERAALLRRRRSATVAAMDTVHGMRLTTRQFATYLSDHPRVIAVVERELYDRLTEPDYRRTADDVAPGDHTQLGTTTGTPPEDERSAQFTEEPTSLTVTSPPGVGRPSWAGQNCTIAFVDIADFSASHRNDRDRLEMRRAMYALLREALEESGVGWRSCYIEDRGDGALIVVPPAVPTAAVIDPMVHSLAARLRRHNQRSHGGARIQLRVAVNVGPVMPDPPSVTGFALIHTARLLDAGPLKDRLATTGADLGFIASQFVYESVIARGTRNVDPEEYESISYRAKTSMVEGWIYLSGAGHTD